MTVPQPIPFISDSLLLPFVLYQSGEEIIFRFHAEKKFGARDHFWLPYTRQRQLKK
jgi:hypothetical protein